MMQLVLKPKIRFGDFVFGENIEDYVSKYNLEYSACAEDDITEWDTYELEKPQLEIYTSDGIIISMASEEECILNGTNVIGMPIDKFIDEQRVTYNSVDKVFLSEGERLQFVYEFDLLSIQVWASNGVIVKVFAYSED